MMYQTMPGKTVDVIIFIEHKDRELAIASHIAIGLEDLGLNVSVCSSIYHLVWSLIKLTPKVIVTPSTSFGKGSAAYLFFSVFGSSIRYVNLNYEQFISSWKGSYKTSSHEHSKNEQLQLVWGDYFKRELIKNGVSENGIIITGRPSLELLKSKYGNIDKAEFDNRFPKYLDKEVCFIGLTDGLAFVSDNKIESMVEAGANREGLLQHIDYVKANMRALFQEIVDEANLRDDFVFVLRPHPSVPESAYYGIFDSLNLEVPSNVYVTKEQDAFWWLSVARYFVTNYSTLCLESKVLAVPTFVYESIENKNIENYWYTKTAYRCSSLSEVFSESVGLNEVSSQENYYIDFQKKGLSETILAISNTLKDIEPVKYRSISLVLVKNWRKVASNILRNFYVKSGIKPFDKVSRGLVEDYFDRKSVENVIKSSRDEF